MGRVKLRIRSKCKVSVPRVAKKRSDNSDIIEHISVELKMKLVDSLVKRRSLKQAMDVLSSMYDAEEHDELYEDFVNILCENDISPQEAALYL